MRIGSNIERQPGGMGAKLFFASCQAIANFNNRLNTVLGLISAAFVLLIMFLIAIDVLGRYLFSSPLPGTYELGRAAMAGIVFFALAYTQLVGRHVMVETVVRYFPLRFRLMVEILVCLAGVFFFTVMAYWSWEDAMFAMATRKLTGGVLVIPIYPLKLFVTVSAGTITLQFLVSLGGTLRQLFSPRKEVSTWT